MMAFLNESEREDEEALLPGAEYMLTGTQINDMTEPLIDEDEYIDMEVDTRFAERDIISAIKKNVLEITSKLVVERLDLFYDMFPSYSNGGTDTPVWCMPVDHPIHILLYDFMQADPYTILNTKTLCCAIAVWEDVNVHDAINYIMEYESKSVFVPAETIVPAETKNGFNKKRE